LKLAPICAPFRSSSAIVIWKKTTIYLHLSQKHLGETASPLDALSLSPAPANDRPRSKK
jgi:hypothetical protein